VANVGEPTYAKDVNQFGVVAYGTRQSAVTTSGGTVLGVLRLDNLSLVSGYLYLVYLGTLRPDLTAPTTDRAKYLIQYNSSGTATTSSTIISRSEGASSSGLDLNTVPSPTAIIIPSTSTTTASVLLSVQRVTGTGTITTPPSPVASDEYVTMTIINFGPAPADTGVAV
jgi:hypothetical protein